MTTRKKLYLEIFILALLALPVTGYLVNEHYKPEGETGTICDFNETFNCTTVNKSSYAMVFRAIYLDIIPDITGFDIPFSVAGVITYAIVALLALIGLVKKTFNNKYINHKTLPWIFLAITGVGTAFSAYLTYIEAFVLHAWCIFCVVQAILVVIMLGVSVKLVRKTKQ